MQKYCNDFVISSLKLFVNLYKRTCGRTSCNTGGDAF